jgi:glutathione synthase/RimK-type ligase-like ATP-grasp enzyme
MILFVVSEIGQNYSRRIERAAARNRCRTGLLIWRDFDPGVIRRLNPSTDVIFFRTGAKSAVQIARAFEDAGFRVINDSRFIQLSAQKNLANVFAKANGIPTPDLNVVIEKRNVELLAMYLRQYGSLVAKPIMSRDKGRYVYPVTSDSDFINVAKIPGSHILVQSEVRFDRLVRTIVLRNGMLAEATVYDTKHDTWKATVCENLQARHYRHPPASLIQLAEKTLRAFGGDIAYIDYFETSRGFVFSEINQACNLLPQERITGFPIARHLGGYLAGIGKHRARVAVSR